MQLKICCQHIYKRKKCVPEIAIYLHCAAVYTFYHIMCEKGILRTDVVNWKHNCNNNVCFTNTNSCEIPVKCVQPLQGYTTIYSSLDFL